MNRKEMKAHYLSLIDRDTRGNRCDVTPVFEDPLGFGALVEDLVGRLAGLEFKVVAAIDALGFVLGTAVALRMGKGLVVVRKGGKLPVAADREEFVDYSGERKSLELRTGAIAVGHGCSSWTNGLRRAGRWGRRSRWWSGRAGWWLEWRRLTWIARRGWDCASGGIGGLR
jgi:hypothetical protein